MKTRDLVFGAAGAGAGLTLHGLLRIATALYWPRTAAGLSSALLCGAAVGAAAFFLFLENREHGADRAGPWILSLWTLWGLAALAVFALVPPATATAAFILAAGPALLVPAVLAAGDRPGRGLFLAGLGLFLAGTALLAHGYPPGVTHPVKLCLGGLALSAAASILLAGGKGRIGAAFAGGALLALPMALLTGGGDLLEIDGGKGVPAGLRREITEEWSGIDRLEAAVGPRKGVVTFNRGMRSIAFGAGKPFRMDVPLGAAADHSLDVLALGYPGGDMLTALIRGGVWHENTTSTIVEGNSGLHRLLTGAWKPLGEAVRDGRLKVVGTNPRRFLAQAEGTFDFIILDAPLSEEGHRNRALAYREDYLGTVEAYREILRILEPDGLLLVRGTGTGRTVMTLRKAAAESGDLEPADNFVVVGTKNRPVSKCYYRPQGFSAGDISWMRDALRRRRGEAFYYPGWKRYRYYELLTHDKPLALAFATPQDLSPSTDGRPFLQHLERLRISPSVAALPEERKNYGPWGLQFIPPGDGVFWWALLTALACTPAVFFSVLAVYAHRTGLAKHAAALLWPLFLAGASVTAVFRCLAAMGMRHDPAGGSWGPGIFFLGVGLAWYLGSRAHGTWRVAARILTVTALLAGAAGSGVTGGIASHAAGLLWAAAFSGGAAGGMAGGLIAASGTVLPRAEGLTAAAFLLGGAVMWPLASLIAVSFGFPALWLTAAAATAGTLYTTRSL